MIRGISFKISQKEPNVLLDILSAIDLTKFYWYNIKEQAEVYTEELEDDFFLKDYYKGEEFFRYIEKSNLIIFLKFQAYLQFSDYENIRTYDDFIKSDCQLILLIYDCEYVELYVKDSNYATIIYEEAIKNGYDTIDYITDNNDERTSMDIC